MRPVHPDDPGVRSAAPLDDGDAAGQNNIEVTVPLPFGDEHVVGLNGAGIAVPAQQVQVPRGQPRIRAPDVRCFVERLTSHVSARSSSSTHSRSTWAGAAPARRATTRPSRSSINVGTA